jgi:hypothetical protein
MGAKQSFKTLGMVFLYIGIFPFRWWWDLTSEKFIFSPHHAVKWCTREKMRAGFTLVLSTAVFGLLFLFSPMLCIDALLLLYFFPYLYVLYILYKISEEDASERDS